MKRYKLVDSENTSSWCWDKNPIQGVAYNIEELRKMYGYPTEPDFESIEEIINNWEDENWQKFHGKWIEVTDKLVDDDK